MRKLLFITIFFFIANTAYAEATISVMPERIIQGDPILITIDGTSTISNVTFGETSVPFFTYQNKTRALVGFDIARKPSDYKIVVTLSSGEQIEKIVTISAREKIEAPFTIPDNLGGTNTSSARTLVSTLAQENATFLNLYTGKHAFWKVPFSAPIAEPLAITDPYGYSRGTSGYSVTHKGADFRANIGTPVYAMNRGVVRIVRTYRNYGKTIVVDHGLGLQTFYMHLSKMYVNPGELVLPGQIIGRSGDTGYALGPHLHISVRIKQISIDPIKFLSLFGVKAN